MGHRVAGTWMVGALAIAAGQGCADRASVNSSGKVGESKAEVIGATAKPVRAAMRWSGVVTAEVADPAKTVEIARTGTQSGTLAIGDPVLSDGSFFDGWIYEASAGEELAIRVKSEEFDTYLMVMRADDGSGMGLLAEDDDGGEGTNSALTVRLRNAGRYGIVVNSYRSGQAGSYQLVIQSLTPAEARIASGLPVIRGNSVIQSELRRGENVLPDGTRYRSWSYHGDEGEQVMVTMESPDFDTYLAFGQGRIGSSFELIAEDDDGGMATNSRLSVTLPADGTYTIVANSHRPAVGHFALRMESQRPVNWAEIYPGGGDPAGRYALLVGIDDYPGGAADLRGPTGDVAIMRNLLVDTYGFSQDDIVTLTDREASRQNITRAFLMHLGQAGPDGVAVFFYSGHGSRLDDNLGIDSPLDEEANGVDEALVVWGTGEDTNLILDDELGFLADRLSTDRTLLVVDACFSGTASLGPDMEIQSKAALPPDLTNLRLPKNFVVGVSKGDGMPSGATGAVALDRLRQPERHVLLAASSENELSWTAGQMPGSDRPVSVFTYYLGQVVEDLGRSATFEAVHAELVARVADWQAERELPPQTPQVAGRAAGEAIASFLGRR